jgi:signal transduction histidine kinase
VDAVRGSGLGLAIVRSLVKAHGGDVVVTSELGVGTTVRVVLPGVVPEVDD